MYEVTVEDVFSSAHRLRNYKGKCENLHGHNWKVRVTVSGQNLDNIGLLIDFHVVKEKLRDVIDILDHTDLNSISFFKKINPTSENICFYIYRKMKVVLKKYPVEIKRVDVWENDKQYASYFEG
jgi:6-pyruvoyltetrahydropterin/6-carboxytetrahydropterin synthase